MGKDKEVDPRIFKHSNSAYAYKERARNNRNDKRRRNDSKTVNNLGNSLQLSTIHTSLRYMHNCLWLLMTKNVI